MHTSSGGGRGGLSILPEGHGERLKRQRDIAPPLNPPVLIERALLLFPDHCYFVGVQYHPEFTSRPIKPSPPYFGLLLAAAGKLPGYLAKGCRLSPR